MTTKRHNSSAWEEHYNTYLADKQAIVNLLEDWVHENSQAYPYEAVEYFLKKYAKDDELSRIIVVQRLAIDCLANCFGQMGKLDARLLEQAKNVPSSEAPEEKEPEQEKVYQVVFSNKHERRFKNIIGTYDECLSWIETNRNNNKSDFTDFKGGIVQIINITIEGLAYEEFIPKE